MPQSADSVFYQLYFQQAGVAEAELAADPRRSIRRILYAGSGDVPRRNTGAGTSAVGMLPRNGGFLTRMPDTDMLPTWIDNQDIDFYAQQFQRSGFRGGLNGTATSTATGSYWRLTLTRR